MTHREKIYKRGMMLLCGGMLLASLFHFITRVVQEPELIDADTGITEEIPLQDKEVALTFDDGPSAETTAALLDGLAERGVRATFFVIGANAEQNPDLLRRMIAEGHVVGCHTYSHVRLDKLTDEAACEEVTLCNQIIEAATGITVRYIRPPYGSWRESLYDCMPMDLVTWDVDPLDWRYQNTDRIVKSVLKDVEPGDIILLHDVYKTSVDAALIIVDELTAQGYTFVTVDEILLD